MRFTRFNFAILLLWSAVARANEHGGAAPAVAIPRDQKEFVEKTVKLNSLAARLDESEKHFAELVHEKQEATTPAAKQPLLREMVEVAKQRNLNVGEYNKLKADLALRYPNQGEHINRHYQRREEHSAEDLERRVVAAPSLDELLIETKHLIDRQYPAPGAPAARAPAASSEAVPPKPPRLRLER